MNTWGKEVYLLCLPVIVTAFIYSTVYDTSHLTTVETSAAKSLQSCPTLCDPTDDRPPGSTSALLTMPKPLTMWITTNCGKFLKKREYQTTWPASWDLYAGQEATVRTGHGTTDWFQIRKGVHQGCILSPCLFNIFAEYIMRNAGLDKHKLESRLLGEIPTTSDMQMIPPLWQKAKKN